MQRFISGSSCLLAIRWRRGHLKGTIGRSGKEAEKRLGKIFAKMPFAGCSSQCFGTTSPVKLIRLDRSAAAGIADRNTSLLEGNDVDSGG
jgi:hypothetical protein